MYFFSLGETSTIGGCFLGLLFREHPKAQPGGGFRSPGSNLHTLVYKASDLITAPRRLLTCMFDVMFIYADLVIQIYAM